LASLPEPMRQVVERRLQGYTVAEIARDLTISQRATERLFQSVRQRIGDFLELSALPAPSTPICLRQGTAKTVAEAPAKEMVDDSKRIKIA
jgi:ECF sigma factor